MPFFAEVLLRAPYRRARGVTITGVVVFRGFSSLEDPQGARQEIMERFRSKSLFAQPDLDGQNPRVEVDLTMQDPQESRKSCRRACL